MKHHWKWKNHCQTAGLERHPLGGCQGLRPLENSSWSLISLDPLDAEVSWAEVSWDAVELVLAGYLPQRQQCSIQAKDHHQVLPFPHQHPCHHLACCCPQHFVHSVQLAVEHCWALAEGEGCHQRLQCWMLHHSAHPPNSVPVPSDRLLLVDALDVACHQMLLDPHQQEKHQGSGHSVCKPGLPKICLFPQYVCL